MNNESTCDATDEERAELRRIYRGWRTEDDAAASAQAPSPAPAPAPAPASAPAPGAWWGHGPAPSPAPAPTPATDPGGNSDVEVVPGPDGPVVELVDVADVGSDTDVAEGDSGAYEEVIDGDGESDDNEEVVDNSDVEVVGGVDATPPSVVQAMI